MTETNMPLTVQIYRRPGCHLCDDAEGLLADAIAAMATNGTTARVERIDITTDPALEERYGTRIPVIAARSEEIDLDTSTGPIRRLLEQAHQTAANAG